MKYPLVFLLLLTTVALAFSSEPDKYWLFFRDKGQALQKVNWNTVEDQLSERAKWRRAKVKGDTESLVDETDVPVYQPYINELRAHGYEPIVISKWLNAVSVYGDAETLQRIQLPFIEKIQPVGHGKRHPVTFNTLKKTPATDLSTILDYGPSLTQNEMMRVPTIHAYGFAGQGVLIAVFDSGFSLQPTAFDALDVVATYDFIHDDENVELEEGDSSGAENHGTIVLSALAGYDPGNLIGPAFQSSYLLAKTEDVGSETEIEEDYWIAAAEWAESRGADIITSSLGYIDWYEYEDMDGETAPITIAADMAFDKGVVVITSAGNEGDDAWFHITAPADGKNVIAVGAVNSLGDLAAFSSRGPTSDGRIKPEVVAMGVNTVVVYPGNRYGTANGTSLSCPMITGVAGLILSAHPELTPTQVRQALIQSADKLTQPSNEYGFGLVDALDAVNYGGVINEPAEETKLISTSPNPFSYHMHSGLIFKFDLKEKRSLTIELYNILGQYIDVIVETTLPGGRELPVLWNGQTSSYQTLAAGIYFYRIHLGDETLTGKFTLLP